MNYKPGQHQFVQFAGYLVNIEHIVEIEDDGLNCCTIRLVTGTEFSVAASVADFAKEVGLDYIDWKS